MIAVRHCIQSGHNDQRVICINTNPHVNQKWACGLCIVDQQNGYVPLDNFLLQVQQLYSDYQGLNIKKQLKQKYEQIQHIKQTCLTAIEQCCTKLEQEQTHLQEFDNHNIHLLDLASNQDPYLMNDYDISELLQFMQWGTNMWIYKEIEERITKLDMNISKFQTHTNNFIEPLKIQEEVALLNTVIMTQDLRDLYKEYEQQMIIELPKYIDGIRGQFKYQPIQQQNANVQYVGEWHQDDMNGVGLLVNNDDNCVYKGYWKNNELIWGIKLDRSKEVLYKGCMIHSTGYSYSQSGMGIEINIMHEQYIGQFNNGLQNGQGIMKYKDNSIYEGQWKQGEWEGQGQYTFANKDTYKGQFWNNMFHGQGDLNCLNTKYNGQFKNGVKEGHGQLFINQKYLYEGFFVNDKKQGDGSIKYTNGTKFTGKFHNDLKHGEGQEEAIVAETDWQQEGVFTLTMFRELQIRGYNGQYRQITCITKEMVFIYRGNSMGMTYQKQWKLHINLGRWYRGMVND